MDPNRKRHMCSLCICALDQQNTIRLVDRLELEHVRHIPWWPRHPSKGVWRVCQLLSNGAAPKNFELFRLRSQVSAREAQNFPKGRLRRRLRARGLRPPPAPCVSHARASFLSRPTPRGRNVDGSDMPRRCACVLLSPYAQKSCREGPWSQKCKKLAWQVFGTQHPANAKTAKFKLFGRAAQAQIAWAGLHSGSGLRPLGGSRGAPPVDPSGYWEESRHGRLGTHYVPGVDTVCVACKALAERAERVRSKFSAKTSKVPKHLHCRSKLKISKNAWLPRRPNPKTLFLRRKICRKLKLL